MNWTLLESAEQISGIKQHQGYSVIFKHSTRCSISAMAKNRLDKAISPASILFYYLDLLKYRPISNKIADDFHIHHQSPQVLIIKNGECTYEESHNGIDMQDIAEQITI